VRVERVLLFETGTVDKRPRQGTHRAMSMTSRSVAPPVEKPVDVFTKSAPASTAPQAIPPPAANSQYPALTHKTPGHVNLLARQHAAVFSSSVSRHVSMMTLVKTFSSAKRKR
jgi:hypothetical protein